MSDAKKLNVTPFEIPSAEQDIADLKTRLALTRWPDKETPTDWSQGIPLSYMQEIKEYWQDEYDWPRRVARSYKYASFLRAPQFRQLAGPVYRNQTN